MPHFSRSISIKTQHVFKMSKPPPDPIFTLRGHNGSISHVHFSTEIIGNTEVLLSSSSCGEMFLWDLKAFRPRSKFIGHSNKDILWTDSAGGRVYTQGRDGTLCIWQVDKDSWEKLSTKPHNALGFCKCSLLKGGAPLLIACPTPDMSTLEVLDVNTMQTVMSTSQLVKEKKYGMCMTCKLFRFPGSNKPMLVCGFENGSLVLFSVEEQRIVSEVFCNKDPVVCLDVDVDYRRKGVAASINSELTVWGCTEDDGMAISQRVTVTNPGITSLAVRGDGKIICTGGSDHRIRVFSWKNMRSLAVLDFHDEQIHCLAFSSKNVESGEVLLAAGSKDKKISLWSLYN